MPGGYENAIPAWMIPSLASEERKEPDVPLVTKEEKPFWQTIFHWQEGNQCYSTNEYIVQTDGAGRYRYGWDGGCSCYDGFDESNFTTTDRWEEIRKSFAGWVFEWYEGVGEEAEAWEAFHKAVPRHG